ncbi:hypothetical protein EDB89DRAFT_1930043, partial [Lactarius sanguifluus]
MSMSRGIPTGIEIPGPIALTDSNSSRRSGSGRLSETLTSVWGNNPPSIGPSANSSVLPSPLEGPTSRSAILNALQPLASVPEGSAIPEVVHADPGADPGAQAGMFEAYRNEPPKTPKAETPRASASPSRIPVSASAMATSPKPPATPKAASRVPTTAPSPRTGGTPRGLSIYSNGSQPPAVATPRGSVLGTTSPGHVIPPADAAPPEPEQGAAQSELQPSGTPKPTSRVPTKAPNPPSPQPPKPPSRIPSPQPTEPAASNTEARHIPVAEAGPLAPATDAESRGASRKTSRATSKTASKVGSKAVTPRGAQTPKPEEPTAEAWSTSASEEVTVSEITKAPSVIQSPLATVHEDPAHDAVTSQGNPEAPHEPSDPSWVDPVSFPGLSGALGGSVAATSALGWGGFGNKNKSKPSTPKISTAWGAATSLAPSVAESTGAGGWGSATGNNSRSNSTWFGMDPITNNSVNPSTADLLGDGSNRRSYFGAARPLRKWRGPVATSHD